MTASIELLDLWEAGAAAFPDQRDGALLRAFGNATVTSLSERNAALFELRARLFGPIQPLRCECTGCGAMSEFTVDCEALARSVAPARDRPRTGQLRAGGFIVHFRLPGPGDVRAAARRDDRAFERSLLERCVTRLERTDRSPCTIADLTNELVDRLSARMEALEPGASVVFEVACPQCAATWTAPMDVGEVLWSELRAQAERLILDIDLLARAYGWTESDILALSPLRRAAYLQLARAAA